MCAAFVQPLLFNHKHLKHLAYDRPSTYGIYIAEREALVSDKLGGA